MPLTQKRKLAELVDTPYLKFVNLELDSESAATILGGATAASRQIETPTFAMFMNLKNNPQQFFEYTNMSERTFGLLKSKIGPKIKKNKVNFMPSSINEELRLIVTLRYLIANESYRTLASRFGIGKTTCTDIIYEVCSVICEALCEEYLPTLTVGQWQSIADNFYRKTGFPNCMGILKGVNMTFVHREYRRKGPVVNPFTNLLLETVIDDNGVLLATEIRATGPSKDGSTARLFPLSGAMHCWERTFPPSTRLPNSNVKAPCILLADDQFPATTVILKPEFVYGRNLLGEHVRSAKKRPESIFNKMMSRWMVLKRPITCNENVARTMLQAISILHNFILAHDGPELFNTLPEPCAKWQGVSASVVDDRFTTSDDDVQRVRRIFQDYFLAQERQGLKKLKTEEN